MAPLPATTRPPFVPARGIAWWLMAGLVAVLTAWLTLKSVQLGCVITMLVLAVGLYVRNRTAGLTVVWLIWLLAPLLRRIFLLSEPIQTADPLALAPFLVTAAIIVLELTQVELSRRARRYLILLVAAYALGLVLGLLVGPQAAAFAFFAYGTAVGCFVIGYREAEQQRLVLPTVLMIALPLLSLYAFRQYFLPLPDWDHAWLRSADINSVGSPESGRIRVWSTLNSPGTFALVLGVTALVLVTWRRLTPLKVVGLVAVMGALALTYVRSAWVGIVLTLFLMVLATRGAAVKRLLPVGVVLLVVAPLILSGSTGVALSERFNSLFALNTDESAQARQATPTGLLPVAAARPIGTGLGTAGEPSRLNQQSSALRYPDNGYLSLIGQVGPVGFVVVISILLSAVASGWRNAWRRRSSTDVLVFAVLAYMVITLFAGDQFFGIGGMIMWYMAGIAVRRREIYERTSA